MRCLRDSCGYASSTSRLRMFRRLCVCVTRASLFQAFVESNELAPPWLPSGKDVRRHVARAHAPCQMFAPARLRPA